MEDQKNQTATNQGRTSRLSARVAIAVFLALLIITSAGVSWSLSNAKLKTFSSTWAWDLAYFNHSFWLATHGGDTLTINPWGTNAYGLFSCEGPSPWKRTHFQPVLLMQLPFYRLWPTTQGLLAMQCLLVALGVLPIYGIARLISGSAVVALLLAALYAFDVHWLMVAQNDFRPISISVTFYLATAYFLLNGRIAFAILVAVGVVSCREEMAFVLLVLSIPVWFYHRRQAMNKRLLLSAIPPAVAVLAWLAQLVYFRLVYDAWIGLPVNEMAASDVFLDRIIAMLTTARPQNLLAIAAPQYWVIMLFIPWTDLLANPQISSLDCQAQYWQYWVPHLIGSALCVTVGAGWIWAQVRRRWAGAERLVTIGLALLVLSQGISYARSAGQLHRAVAARQTPFRQLLWSMSQMLPPETAVTAPQELIAPFSSRRRITTWSRPPVISPGYFFREPYLVAENRVSALKKTDVLIVSRKERKAIAGAGEVGMTLLTDGDDWLVFVSPAYFSLLEDWLASVDYPKSNGP